VSPVWGNPKGTPEYSTNIGHISTAINKIKVFVNMMIGCKSTNEKSAYVIKISHVYHNTGSRCPYFINQHDTHFVIYQNFAALVYYMHRTYIYRILQKIHDTNIFLNICLFLVYLSITTLVFIKTNILMKTFLFVTRAKSSVW
jgi:hypothetical protein